MKTRLIFSVALADCRSESLIRSRIWTIGVRLTVFSWRFIYHQSSKSRFMVTFPLISMLTFLLLSVTQRPVFPSLHQSSFHSHNFLSYRHYWSWRRCTHSRYFKPLYTQQSPRANIHGQVRPHSRFLVISRPSILFHAKRS